MDDTSRAMEVKEHKAVLRAGTPDEALTVGGRVQYRAYVASLHDPALRLEREILGEMGTHPGVYVQLALLECEESRRACQPAG